LFNIIEIKLFEIVESQKVVNLAPERPTFLQKTHCRAIDATFGKLWRRARGLQR
jgi:hypothetical protein